MCIYIYKYKNIYVHGYVYIYTYISYIYIYIGGLPNIDVVIARSDRDIQLWLDKIILNIQKQNARDSTKKIIKNTQNDTDFSIEKSDNDENLKIGNVKFVIGLDVEWRPFHGGGTVYAC
jgi:hypothetical protein